MIDKSDNTHTVDGAEIIPNLRVFGYDAVWGNVDPKNWDKPYTGPGSEYFDGWYDVILDSGRKALYNGTRMITRTQLSTDPKPGKRI